MRFLRLRPALVVILPVVLAALIGGDAGAAAVSLTPAQTVRAYIGAINAKDGNAICDLLHPAEAKAIGYDIPAIFQGVGHVIRPIPCARLAVLIGSGGGRDNAQRWRHAKILRMGAPKSGGDGLVSLDVRMHYTWQSGPDARDTWTRFWLTQVADRWVIVRRSSTLDMAIWSDTDDFSDERPATREPRATDVKIPAAKFGCRSQVYAAGDPAGDTHALAARWLDIRHVVLGSRPAGCVAVQLAAPPMPGTEFDISFGTADNSQFQSSAHLVIEADGQVVFTGSVRRPVGGVDYGMADKTTLVMQSPDFPSVPGGTVSVIARPISVSEPLIRTQPPLFGGDIAGPEA